MSNFESINKQITDKNGLDETSSTSIIRFLNIILSMIIIFGIAGNIINLIIFGQKSMRRVSTFRFLFYLSASDLLVLSVCSVDALLRFGFQIEIRLFSTVICRLHTFLTYFLTHSSSMILTAVSIDRAMVVSNKTFFSLFSFKKAKKKRLTRIARRTRSKKRSYMSLWVLNFKIHRVDLVIACIFIGLFSLNIHYLIFLNLNPVYEHDPFDSFIQNFMHMLRNNLTSYNLTSYGLQYRNPMTSHKPQIFHICFPIENSTYYYFLNNVWIWCDLLIYSIVPFIIMSICSVIILCNIEKKTQRIFNRLLERNNANRKIVFKRARRNRQLIYMLLVTNLFFLFSILPCCIAFLVFHGSKSDSILFQLSVHLLLYSNNSINFLLYGISSQKFRQELAKMFFKARRKKTTTVQHRLSLKV